MRLGIYCNDVRAAELFAGWRSAAEFVVVSVGDNDPWVNVPLLNMTRRESWEELLTEPKLDAVLVGGTDPGVLDAARKFAQAGTPLWVLPHPEQGLMFAYEINLAAQETQAPLQAVFPHRSAVVWQSNDARSIAPDYVEFVRHIPPANANEATIARADVDRHLLMDLDLLTWQLGHRSRVTTLRSGETGPQMRRQTVTLAGDGVPEIVWSIEPSVDHSVTAECRFHSGGKTILYRELHGIWQRENCDISTSSASPFAALAPWTAAITAFELLDAVEHSLERKRTIELHRETVSERAIFKTRMAAWGCGILILTLLLMVSFLMVASLVPPEDQPGTNVARNDPYLQVLRTILAIGRIAVFAPLFIFLIAQLLLPLTRSARKR